MPVDAESICQYAVPYNDAMDHRDVLRGNAKKQFRQLVKDIYGEDAKSWKPHKPSTVFW